MVISTEGEWYLGGAIGTSSFVRQYVQRKVECWVNQIKKLSKIVETQPHSICCVHPWAVFEMELPFKGNWKKDQLDDVLASLEKAMPSHFIPALTGQPPPGGHT